MPTLGSRLMHAFNSFLQGGEQPVSYQMGPISTTRPDRPRFRYNSERTIITSVYNRMAVDVSDIRIEHVRLDVDTQQYKETIQSGLNRCFNTEANIDQGGRHFRFDIAMTLFQEGVIAIVPVDTTADPRKTDEWDVRSMRVGVIVQWMPQHVRVRAYNENTGQNEEVTVSKRQVAIVENPFYSVMNEPNSTLQRLIRKLSLLDHVDEISSSGKLDLIIQLPYQVQGTTREAQAKKRIDSIKEQLTNSTYGIAYADATEKITQLNRSIENNLLEQVKYLTDRLYSELGLTSEIMDGTADEQTMLNYVNRLLEPVLDAVTEAVKRTFLSKTAQTQGQSIMYFQTPFKLLPIGKLADVIDVLSRNQIVTPNEIRPTLGLKPSTQPQADQLINSNMPLKDQVTGDDVPEPDEVDPADTEEANLDRAMTALGIT